MRLKTFLNEMTGMEDLFPQTSKKIMKAMDRNGWKLKIRRHKVRGFIQTWLEYSRPEGPDGAKLDIKAHIDAENWENKMDGTYIIINCYDFTGMYSKGIAELLAGELKTAGLNAKAGKFKGGTVVRVLETG
jgi:hypothetical protein